MTITGYSDDGHFLLILGTCGVGFAAGFFGFPALARLFSSIKALHFLSYSSLVIILSLVIVLTSLPVFHTD